MYPDDVLHATYPVRFVCPANKRLAVPQTGRAYPLIALYRPCNEDASSDLGCVLGSHTYIVPYARNKRKTPVPIKLYGQDRAGGLRIGVYPREAVLPVLVYRVTRLLVNPLFDLGKSDEREGSPEFYTDVLLGVQRPVNVSPARGVSAIHVSNRLVLDVLLLWDDNAHSFSLPHGTTKHKTPPNTRGHGFAVGGVSETAGQRYLSFVRAACTGPCVQLTRCRGPCQPADSAQHGLHLLRCLYR